MKGIIISYGRNLTPRKIIDINNTLFGRVVKVRRKNKDFFYYYRGMFHNVPFYKLANGCYFIANYTNISIDDIKYIETLINIKAEDLKTAEEYFIDKYKEQEVINLG